MADTVTSRVPVRKLKCLAWLVAAVIVAGCEDTKPVPLVNDQPRSVTAAPSAGAGGQTGAAGATGAPGTTGTAGATGAPSPTAATEAAGSTGTAAGADTTGATGDAGASSVTGATGSPGAVGAPGATPSPASLTQEFVQAEIVKASRCAADADCVSAGSMCPFGCVIGVHRDELPRIRKLLADFERTNPDRCVYRCQRLNPPTCVEGRCKALP